MIEEAVDAVDDRHTSSCYVGIRLSLHGLPPIGPEPGLVRTYGHDRNEFDSPAIVLHEPDLRPRLVQPQPAPWIGVKSHGPSRSYRQVVRFHAKQQQ